MNARRSGQPWPAHVRAQTIDTYLAGGDDRDTVVDLGRAVGVPPSTVHTWLTAAGIKVAATPNEDRRRVKARKRAAELRRRGWKVNLIASEVHVPADTVKRWLSADGVKKPPVDELLGDLMARDAEAEAKLIASVLDRFLDVDLGNL